MLGKLAIQIQYHECPKGGLSCRCILGKQGKVENDLVRQGKEKHVAPNYTVLIGRLPGMGTGESRAKNFILQE